MRYYVTNAELAQLRARNARPFPMRMLRYVLALDVALVALALSYPHEPPTFSTTIVPMVAHELPPVTVRMPPDRRRKAL